MLLLGVDAATDMSDFLKDHYITTRFTVEEDAWPPDQPKEYTTLAMIHHKNQLTDKQITNLAKGKGDGEIEKIASITSDSSSSSDSSTDEYLKEYLQESVCTHSISDIIAPIEDPNNSHSRTVLIEGAPGLGKTVLLKQIAYEWAEKKILMQSKFLFLLRLRDPGVRKINSIFDLVHHFTRNSVELCTESIAKTDGKNVVVLLDGYDELPPELRNKSFIADIISHKALSSAAVVVSSHPHASRVLHSSDIVSRVDILGFTKKDQVDFFQSSLKNQPTKMQLLNEYISGKTSFNQ